MRCFLVFVVAIFGLMPVIAVASSPAAKAQPSKPTSQEAAGVMGTGFDLASPARPNGTCYNTGINGVCEGFGFPAPWMHLPATLFSLGEGDIGRALKLTHVLDDALSANFRNVNDADQTPMGRILTQVKDDFLLRDRLTRAERRRFARAVEYLLAYFEDHD